MPFMHRLSSACKLICCIINQSEREGKELLRCSLFSFAKSADCGLPAKSLIRPVRAERFWFIHEIFAVSAKSTHTACSLAAERNYAESVGSHLIARRSLYGKLNMKNSWKNKRTSHKSLRVEKKTTRMKNFRNEIDNIRPTKHNYRNKFFHELGKVSSRGPIALTFLPSYHSVR